MFPPLRLSPPKNSLFVVVVRPPPLFFLLITLGKKNPLVGKGDPPLPLEGAKNLKKWDGLLGFGPKKLRGGRKKIFFFFLLF